MTAAIPEPSPLRKAAAHAGGINALCRELDMTRQAFYGWEEEGGAPPITAILIARLTGVDHFALCAERHHDALARVADYFARR